jgi:hypothetical protein
VRRLPAANPELGLFGVNLTQNALTVKVFSYTAPAILAVKWISENGPARPAVGAAQWKESRFHGPDLGTAIRRQ